MKYYIHMLMMNAKYVHMNNYVLSRLKAKSCNSILTGFVLHSQRINDIFVGNMKLWIALMEYESR